MSHEVDELGRVTVSQVTHHEGCAAPDGSSAPSGLPVLAIVVPVYGHPSLLIEAVESVLGQRTFADFRIVLVNDGCPLEQTHDTCAAYASAYPERIIYLRKRNGGLSSARNHGIQAALDLWPSVRAIFFLDADNRLHPTFVDEALRALQEHPAAGWLFPDIPNFGAIRAFFDTSGPFSPLELLARNYCEAGSLVRREVFESGLRFDESMRHGFEDWEFWLHASTRGFVGAHSPALRFWYRRRQESMLADSDRESAATIGYIRRKHSRLFSLRQAAATAALTWARFAFWLTDQDMVVLSGTGPDCGDRVTWAEFARRLRRSRTARHRQPCPSTLVVADHSVISALDQHGLLGNVLWSMEADLEEHHLWLLTMEEAFGIEKRARLSTSQSSTLKDREGAVVCALPSRLLDDCLRDPLPGWLGSVLTGSPHPRTVVRHLAVTSLEPPAPLRGTAVQHLCERVQEYGPHHRRAPVARIDVGRVPYRRADVGPLIRDIFGTSAPPPLALTAGRSNIGFVVPLCEFSGVERVAMNVARECQRNGYRVHLFVVGSGQARFLSEFTSTFASIHLVPDASLAAGHRLFSLLGGMDVVINNHSVALNSILGDLRRQGTKIITQLHVVDVSANGVPCGPPFDAVQHEHAIHLMTAPSRRLVDWLRAWGIPEEKVMLVPNAPGFELPGTAANTALLARRRRTSDQPLRVLFMARFDRQKGLDRVADLVRLSALHVACVEWRIVGKPVLRDDVRQRAEDLRAVEAWVHPPAVDAQTLMGYYSWADVLVLPSRFEGSPLSILEAQSLGCVPLATACGAIDEQIEDGGTGYLFENTVSNQALSSAMLERLITLHRDRSTLLRIAVQAAKGPHTRSWRESTKGLIARLDEWFPSRGAHP